MKHLSLLQKEFIKKSIDIMKLDKSPTLMTDTQADALTRQTDVKAMVDTPASRLTKDPEKEFIVDADLAFQDDNKPVGIKQLNLKEKSKV